MDFGSCGGLYLPSTWGALGQGNIGLVCELQVRQQVGRKVGIGWFVEEKQALSSCCYL